MLKTTIACAVLVCLALHAPAIELRGVTVRAGGAYVSSDLQYQGAELVEVDAIVEPSASVSLRWRNSYRSRFDILTEVGYLRGGYDLGDTEYRATFLQFPVLLRSDLGGDEASIYLVFGPSVTVLVDKGGDLTDRYNDLSLAGQAGLGFFRRLNRNLSFYSEFRFSGDLTNLYSKGGDADTLESVRQRVLSLSVGIEF